jgi:hypothetical protein
MPDGSARQRIIVRGSLEPAAQRAERIQEPLAGAAHPRDRPRTLDIEQAMLAALVNGVGDRPLGGAGGA